MCDSDLLEQKDNQGSCSSERDPCFFPYSSKKCSVDHPGWAEYFGYMRTGKQSLNTKGKCLEASGKPPGQVTYRKPDCCVPSKNGWAGRFLVGPEDQCASGWGKAEDGGCSDEFPGYRKWKMKFIPPLGSGWSKDDTAKVALNLPGFLPGQVTPSVPYFFDGTYGYWKGDLSSNCNVVNNLSWTSAFRVDNPPNAEVNPFGVPGPVMPEGKVRYAAQLTNFHGDPKDVLSGKIKAPEMKIWQQTWSVPDAYYRLPIAGWFFEFWYDDGGLTAKPVMKVVGLCGSKDVENWVKNFNLYHYPFVLPDPCIGSDAFHCSDGLNWLFYVVTKGSLASDYWQRHPPDVPPGVIQPGVAYSLTWETNLPWLGLISQKNTPDYYLKTIGWANKTTGEKITHLSGSDFSFCGTSACGTGTVGTYVAQVTGLSFNWGKTCTWEHARDNILNPLRGQLGLPDPNGTQAHPAYFDLDESSGKIFAYFTGICPTSSCAGKLPVDCTKWPCCTKETGCPSECHWDPSNPACKHFDFTNLIWI